MSEDELRAMVEKRRKARRRTRGPYRKSAVAAH
jgi:hypothetical protein